MKFAGLNARRTTFLRAGLAIFALASVFVVGFGALRRGNAQPRSSLPDVARFLEAQEGHNRREMMALSDETRRFIWEVERHAFGITSVLSPRVAAGVSRRDRDVLMQLFAPGFAARVVNTDGLEQTDQSFAFAEFRRFVSSDHATRPLDAEQFADWMLEFTRRFRGEPNVQLALLYLTPQKRQPLGGPWTGTWIIRLYGEDADGGPTEIVLRTKFIAERLPKDYANAHAWINSWQVEQVVEARAKEFLMKDMVAESGIDAAALRDNWKESRSDFVALTGSVYACDYNNDGITDLLIVDRNTAPKLYAGTGSFRFADVSIEAGLPWQMPTNSAVAFADLDNDHDEDLMLGPTVYENVAGRFRPRGNLALGPDAVALAIADYDRDGLVDAYVSYAAPEPHRAAGRISWVDDQSGLPNRLLRNLGGFRFEDVTDAAGAAAGNRSTFTSLWLDADDDGWPDLYVINELGPNVLLRNEHNGTFSEHTIGPDFDGFTMGAATGDVDGDGRVDLYLGNMYSKAGLRIIANLPPDTYPPPLMDRLRRFVTGNMLLRNSGGLRFDEVPNSVIAGVGWAYGPALVDLDGDGLLDIHSTCGFASFSRDEPDG
jgi:FG-GAP-like repeat